MSKEWTVYDPNWLVELAKNQIPGQPKVIEALKKCIKAKWESRAYAYFVDGNRPNLPDSPWQFKGNIILEDKKEGTIILDILKDDQIGGIEFLKYAK